MDPEQLQSPSTTHSFVIKCTDVPPEFFIDRTIPKKYFRRYGKVKGLSFKPKIKTCLVEYFSEDGMLNALELGGEFNGKFFNIFRHIITPTKKRKPKKEPDPDWTDDPEIKAELEAMSGSFVPRDYNLRAEPMAVDPITVTPKPAPKLQRIWKAAKGIKSKSKAVTDETLGLTIEQSELVDVIIKQAFTVEEKYKILDARDKLLRSRLKKNLEMKTGPTIGTCPDMCPEKERLLREIQHQIALYEQEDNGRSMNPKLAVKQYSRSSADQEAPLSQELRPVPVLQMTMGYLMHRIMDLCDIPDVNISEWYHFLWDRTRGIRKDITQQELCCQGSVELVEQCARFHIFCSARLVAEDPSVFDQKINTENLTKCLQTLKYMYHDLELKGETCRNEPEFRSYIILLNLNDGNFMWEVQNLRRDIQQSSQVRFALAVHSSLDKNNYVKFFKLVKSTTYLNACILMRYFVQIRLSALNTLLKCYAPRISNASIPVSDLTHILAFENEEAAIEFLECYGLFPNAERTHIILDKKNFAMPEYPYVLDRALKVIESKRISSIGRVVCGRELPPKIYEGHVPQNSFDKDGYLKLQHELKDLFKERQVKEEVDSAPPAIKPTAVPSNIFQIQPTVTTQSVSQNLFQTPKPFQSVFATQPKITITTASEEKEFVAKPFWTPPPVTTTGNVFVMPVVKAKPIELPPTPKRDELEEQKKKEAELELKRQQEEEKRREQIRKEIEEKQRQLQLQQAALLEKKRQVEEIKRAELLKQRQIEEENRRKEAERLKRKEIQNGVSAVINKLLSKVEEMEKQQKLSQIAQNITQRKLKRIIQDWREKTRRKRKRKILDFAPIILSRSIDEEARDLEGKSQYLTLSDMKRYKLGKPLDINTNLTREVKKINIGELVHKVLTQKTLENDQRIPTELFWKITICLPSSEKCCSYQIEDTLQKALGGSNLNLEQCNDLCPVLNYCINIQRTNAARNDCNGFIFIAPEFGKELKNRILTNVRLYKNRIPVVLILGSQPPDVTELKISDYSIFLTDFTRISLIKAVEKGLVFLAKNLERPPPLQMDYLRLFLNKSLGDLWKKSASFSKWNSNYKQCLKDPNTVIYIYNEALQRFKSIIVDESSCFNYPKFSQVFKHLLDPVPESLPCDYRYFPIFWERPSYFRHIDNILDMLRLPKFLGNWPPLDQAELEASILNYCEIFKHPTQVFYKIMSILLQNTKTGGNIGDVVWINIVELLANEKAADLNFSLFGTGFVTKSFYKELVVVYNIKNLIDYNETDWFYINHPLIRTKILDLLRREEVKTPEVPILGIEVDLDGIFQKIQKPRRSFDKLTSELRQCNVLFDDLSESYQIHKRISQKSGEILKGLIERN